jgi:synaptojanin
MVAGYAFSFYSEARITFMPTYKFDVGRDEYDSSEKARIPAWTDRVLRKGTNIRQTSYGSAPLRFSDHRPVYATFDCTVSVIDESVRNAISRDIYTRRKAEVGGATANVDVVDTDDEELIGYDAVEPGLPPASSDRQKWWLENGKMARSTASTPKPVTTATAATASAALNPKRSANPFTPSEESDWIAVPRSASRTSSFSTLSTSPYEHVNHPYLSTTAIRPSPPQQRKLPPPPSFNANALPAQIGRLQMNEEKTPGPAPALRLRTESPPPPPPRRQTAASLIANGTGRSASNYYTADNADAGQALRRASTLSQSLTAKSPPPPVAKKPAHLTSSASPTTAATSSSPLDPKTPQLPRRPSTTVQRTVVTAERRPISTARKSTLRKPSSSTERGTATPQQTAPRAGNTGADSRATAPTHGEPPLLPVRAHDMSQHQATRTVDLLGDGDSADMKGWETLQPQ